jgi:hypothetical protein
MVNYKWLMVIPGGEGYGIRDKVFLTKEEFNHIIFKSPNYQITKLPNHQITKSSYPSIWNEIIIIRVVIRSMALLVGSSAFRLILLPSPLLIFISGEKIKFG